MSRESLRQAGDRLREFFRTADTETPEENSEEAAGIAALYGEVLAGDPGDATAVAGLTVLALGRLVSYVECELGELCWSVADEYPPLPELDDEEGRELAESVVRWAKRARGLDSGDNLAAFAQGFALELLGDTEGAVAAQRDALLLDPHDHAALIRLKSLTDLEFEPGPAPACAHAGDFHLLRLTVLVSNNGTEHGVAWLVTDPAVVRAEADAYFRAHEPAGGGWDRFYVETHRQGEDVLVTDLHDALDGRGAVDWSLAELPALTGEPLVAGQPVRVGGELYFFGRNDYDDVP